MLLKKKKKKKVLHLFENNVAPTPHPSQFAILAACENNFVHNILTLLAKTKKKTRPPSSLYWWWAQFDNNDMLGWGGPQSRLTISYHK